MVDARGTSPGWFVKVGLSLLLLALTGWQIVQTPPAPFHPGQFLVLIGAISSLFHFLVLKRMARDLGRPSRLVTSVGLFRWIRHPMYLSEITMGIGLVLLAPTPITAAVLTLHGLCIWITARHEDRLMAAKFPDEFADWRQRTGLLLPRWRR